MTAMRTSLETKTTPEGIVCTFKDTGKRAGIIKRNYECWDAYPSERGVGATFRELASAEYFILAYAIEARAVEESRACGLLAEGGATMTGKHTPGPWRVTQEWSSTKLKLSGGFGVEAPTPEGPGWPTPSATGFYAMAYPPPHGHDPKSRAEQEANARLIAAAPYNLVEHRALLHLADTLNSRQHAGLEITPTMWGALYDQANRSRAAIAKAESES